MENGDQYEIELKPVNKKPIELIVNRYYKLKYTGQFCHIKGTLDVSNIETAPFIFVGTIKIDSGLRNIFYSQQKSSYIMFGTTDTNYLVELLPEK